MVNHRYNGGVAQNHDEQNLQPDGGDMELVEQPQPELDPAEVRKHERDEQCARQLAQGLGKAVDVVNNVRETARLVGLLCIHAGTPCG